MKKFLEKTVRLGVLLVFLSSLYLSTFSPSNVLAVVGRSCALNNKCDASEVCATISAKRPDGTDKIDSLCHNISSIPDGASLQKTIYPNGTEKSRTQLCEEIPSSATRFPSCVPEPTHAPTGITSCAPDQIPTFFGGQIVECRKKITTFSAPTPKPTPPPPPCGIDAKSCPTALGPISTNPAEFVKDVFGILLSLAGGVALILIMVSGYRLMTSQGNPEKVQAAREQLTSAIVGLLFIIFSLSILQIIGVDILHIPGFE